LILLPQALASMVSVIIGGRLVDRIGVRAVMIPGLLILALATWQLTLVTTYSPYWWIQIMFILRGVALGLTIQPLTVAMLAEVRPQQLAQASSLNTVGRAVFRDHSNPGTDTNCDTLWSSRRTGHCKFTHWATAATT